MIMWIVLGVAIYMIIGLSFANRSLYWIQRAIEENINLDEKLKKDVEYIYSRLSNKERKLFILTVYLSFSVLWLPIYIDDIIKRIKNN